MKSFQQYLGLLHLIRAVAKHFHLGECQSPICRQNRAWPKIFQFFWVWHFDAIDFVYQKSMFSLVNHRFNFGTPRGFEGLEAKPKDEAPCKRSKQNFFRVTFLGLGMRPRPLDCLKMHFRIFLAAISYNRLKLLTTFKHTSSTFH